MLDFFNEIELYHVIFMALFSMGLAIFHTVILTALFGLRFKTWLFFVLNPLLILISYFINNALSGLVFVVLCASVFLLAIIGMFFRIISGTIQDIKERNKLKKKRTPWWQVLLGLTGGLILFSSFSFLGPVTFIVIVIIIVVVSKILPGSENRFFRLQGILPTAPIRSIPMGLIEVTGKVRHIEPLAAPIKSKKCTGYRYTVEDISTDSDGDKSYSTIVDETKCNDFILADDTGEVRVEGKELDLLYLELDEQYSAGSRRYTQYLLKESDEILLIGKAENTVNGNVIAKEHLKKIFALAPVATVMKYNTNKPLLRSLATMAIVLACLIAFILLADVNISDNTVVIGWNSHINLF